MYSVSKRRLHERITGWLVIASLLAGVSTATLARTLPDFTGLVEQQGAAVVNISTTQRRAQQRPVLPKGLDIPDIPEDSPFHEFFKRFFGEGEIPDFDAQSLGSGFIITSDGYVISNNHVVRDADEIIVRMSDRREFKAMLVGADERSDVALLKIDATGLPTVKLGSSYELKVGEWVLAIGSPFGFDHSVTAGIVSAKGRNLPRENYVPFIQTDVAINPGNSGGPLFNLDGEVVGVNSQIFSRTGGFMGLSFAIPIEVAVDVADQLRTQGRVSRGWLGVLIQEVTRELAESFGMDKPRGALIAKVLPDSAAEEAGLKVGDVVVEFNDKKVERSSDLPPIVGMTRVGTRVPVKILRDGKMMTVYVTTSELPAKDEVRVASTQPKNTKESKLGLVVADPTDEERERAGIPEHGVVVREVDEGPARRAGIRVGDLILMLNGEQVDGTEEFKTLAADLPAGKAVSVLVQRDGGPSFLALKTDED